MAAPWPHVPVPETPHRHDPGAEVDDGELGAQPPDRVFQLGSNPAGWGVRVRRQRPQRRRVRRCHVLTTATCSSSMSSATARQVAGWPARSPVPGGGERC